MTRDHNYPDRAPHNERIQFRDAGNDALQLWPDAIGETLAAQLHALHDFGYRHDAKTLGPRLVAAINNEKLRRHKQAEQEWAARTATR